MFEKELCDPNSTDSFRDNSKTDSKTKISFDSQTRGGQDCIASRDAGSQSGCQSSGNALVKFAGSNIRIHELRRASKFEHSIDLHSESLIPAPVYFEQSVLSPRQDLTHSINSLQKLSQVSERSTMCIPSDNVIATASCSSRSSVSGSSHSPPPKRRCNWTSETNVVKKNCSLRSPLSCPSSPLASSLSSQFPMPYASSYSSSSSMLSPSATKLPLATINKPPPPPAPSLVQPQPIASSFYNPHSHPSSNSSLFERLYRASIRVDSSKNLGIRNRNISQEPLRFTSNVGQRTGTFSRSSGACSQDADPTISSSSQNDNLLSRSSITRSPASPSIPSLASLLSSSVKSQKLTYSREPAEYGQAAKLNKSQTSKLPEFRDSFTGPSLPYSSAVHKQASSVTDDRDDQVTSTVNDTPEQMSIPMQGKMYPLPFVGKIPNFTLNFLRTMAMSLCHHCKQNPRTGESILVSYLFEYNTIHCH